MRMKFFVLLEQCLVELDSDNRIIKSGWQRYSGAARRSAAIFLMLALAGIVLPIPSSPQTASKWEY
jgi:hypothetical protein